MSNNRNDEFDFDDDIFGDDSSSGGFDFGDDDELPPVSFGDEVDDMPMIEDEPERGGASRTFIALALLMILVFIGGLALVIFLITRPTGPTDADLTVTYVVAFNATQESFLQQTQTQARAFEIMTLTAISFTDTPSPTFTPSETPTPTEPADTPIPTLDQTEIAATQIQLNFAGTATALAGQQLIVTPEPPPLISDFDLTATAAALIVPTPDLAATAEALASRPPTVTPTSALGAINQTATAIAGAFLTATAQAGGGIVTEATPAPEGQPTAGGFLPIPTPSTLPDTGLFDDLAATGSGGIIGMSMMAFGLVGLIVVVRAWRARLAEIDRRRQRQQISEAQKTEQ
ncbi:hypothetical protein FBR02_04380 [Anaerolineae bacterium CFX9]|nr:hypothetical protein [Anaerolineae bacterium CFX9]